MERIAGRTEDLDGTQRFGDVPISIEVELGRKTLAVANILELKEGNILRLDRSAGENIDLWIGGVLVAFGEIVILDDSAGVRITDFQHQD